MRTTGHNNKTRHYTIHTHNITHRPTPSSPVPSLLLPSPPLPSMPMRCVVVLALLWVTIALTTAVTAQSEGDLRLAGGTATQGRLEIYHSSVWGTVCSDSFSLVNAAVACTQLSLTSVPVSWRIVTSAEQGTGQIWLDELICTGGESTLSQCSHSVLSGVWSNDCQHSSDVWVTCGQTQLAQQQMRQRAGHTTTHTTHNNNNKVHNADALYLLFSCSTVVFCLFVLLLSLCF